jgi:hypothetical protein
MNGRADDDKETADDEDAGVFIPSTPVLGTPQ